MYLWGAEQRLHKRMWYLRGTKMQHQQFFVDKCHQDRNRVIWYCLLFFTTIFELFARICLDDDEAEVISHPTSSFFFSFLSRIT